MCQSILRMYKIAGVIDNGQKKDAEVEFKIDTNNPAIDLYVKEKTDGIDVDLDNFIIRIKSMIFS